MFPEPVVCWPTMLGVARAELVEPVCWILPLISGRFLTNTVPQGGVACLPWSPNHTVPLLKSMSSTLLLTNPPQDWLSRWECRLGVRCPRFTVWWLPYFQLAWLEAIYLLSLFLGLPVSRMSGVALLSGLLGGWNEPVLLRHINVPWPMLTPMRSSCHYQHQSFCLFPTCWEIALGKDGRPVHLSPDTVASDGPRPVLPDSLVPPNEQHKTASTWLESCPLPLCPSASVLPARVQCPPDVAAPLQTQRFRPGTILNFFKEGFPSTCFLFASETKWEQFLKMFIKEVTVWFWKGYWV